MTYVVYSSSKKPSVFVIAKDKDGADKASLNLGGALGKLSPVKTLETLDGAIGADPTEQVDASIEKDGYHVQGTAVSFRESKSDGPIGGR